MDGVSRWLRPVGVCNLPAALAGDGALPPSFSPSSRASRGSWEEVQKGQETSVEADNGAARQGKKERPTVVLPDDDALPTAGTTLVHHGAVRSGHEVHAEDGDLVVIGYVWLAVGSDAW